MPAYVLLLGAELWLGLTAAFCIIRFLRKPCISRGAPAVIASLVTMVCVILMLKAM